jgi:hypothetical protein
MVLLLLNIASGQISEESSLPMFDYKFKGTIFDFTHRPLSPKEIKAYDSLVKEALDPSKRLAKNISQHTKTMAYWALWRIEKSPHVILIRPLAEFIRQLQPKHAEQLKIPSLGQKEVVILARCADPEVIELLIEFLEHPLRGVRAQSLEELQKILDPYLPEEYRRGRLSWLSLEDARKRKEVARFLRDWWKKSKEKVKIDWERIYEVF